MDKLNRFIEQIEDGEYSGREILMGGAVLTLAGILLGIMISPRKTQMIGCNNGNTSPVFDASEEENS